jgi:two-component system response regulator FixJ
MADAKPIVIVDEDEAVRASTAMLLRLLGHEVLAFPSGEALLEAAPRIDADCLLLDADLGDGVDAFTLALALATSGGVPPVILLADEADSATAALAARLGAVDLIEKPWRTERLLDAIARLCAPAAHAAHASAAPDLGFAPRAAPSPPAEAGPNGVAGPTIQAT